MPSIGIIGSGFGALAVAITLLQDGHDDIRLWERSDGIGGVWRDNTYPGAACDVPSALYSFSFEPYTGWESRYAHQPQILAYLRRTAAKYGVTPRVRTGATVVGATYDEAHSQWEVALADGTTDRVDVLVSAVGQLSDPVLPPIPGIDRFQGTAFHSARWDHAAPLSGKRIAVVGTGASATQFVPHLADRTAELLVFQRTPSYILPRPDQRYGRLYQGSFRVVPGALRTERNAFFSLAEQFSRGLDDDTRAGEIIRALALAHLRLRVRDRELREALTPDYPVGCRRILFANSFYPALTRPHVRLVTAAVDEVTEAGIVAGGVHHDVDAIVYGTGFDAQNFLSAMRIEGARGRLLTDVWADGARAHLGVHVPGFPNFFVAYGPNTNLGGGSIVYMLEAQARHIRDVLRRMREGGHRSVTVTSEAAEGFDRAVQHRLERSVWGHCESWYRHPSGRITSNWPGNTRTYADATARLKPEEFAWT
ncbi:4-hydroxyacetophenone monooxygenase [Tsukamurella pulmonis]|uniref:Predicted flavoprotein CzcO associated with the cation diffusion facilitator CzcD n=1 Tax=Tsukamurella pulmonis TaxID=47312 RepID=A0A1H1C9I6_9ACTN|nr:NAD(P)/FAD-dependent oxidoreductase [Tsukamurella pulmonis]KXO90000.1 4-hydroxyacetophenone monooxygenase [Tsukamurella pulmonis]SDQ60851.1 Predicted flavoprotein CzcO associated with the cation diffusion facilitator CzcD [Tsukamurella pulmonis]SUP24015.1 4-hydroxyacetophenone monooxygenase [Tsukamurella pulmonis]